MVQLNRRNLMASSVAAALGASAMGLASAQDDSDTPDAPWSDGELKRFAHVAFGAEFTGPFVTGTNELIFSNQHPSRDNPGPFQKAGVGVVEGFQFDLDGDSDDFEELAKPQTDEEQSKVRVADGEFKHLAREGDPINGGAEKFGHPQTPEGKDIATFAGTRYGNFGYNPDMNQFVATNDEGSEGYLFTNVETSPGSITRMPISRDENGSWSADLENTTNLVNAEAFRELGGTRINCYGDLSPWDTPMSAEENYAHPRLAPAATTGDIVDADSGVGLRGAAAFWNRPDPSTVQDAVDEIFGDDSWYLQGSWALTGVELLAYYLGADPVDQTDDGGNDRTPIGEGYPNPYRYGYIVEIRDPVDDPTPVKHWCMGRAAFEAPDFQEDEKTVYLTSDGENKGIYKFVADEPFPSYDDPANVAGTLHVATVTNEKAANERPPAAVDLEIEWVELGHASNGEVETWIEAYDGITQEDYLETHADTDWQDDLDAALREADEAVARDGNRDYVTDEEIAAWAKQYEKDGPDGVDEDLRKVPFLETRAAAKEIGATVEFRKAEGVDSVEGAEPGDYVYLGISELNAGMSDDAGDIRLQRVDGGVVYRAKLDDDYGISTLEPVVVGADASDPEPVIDDAPINIDNVLVMDDGRVLLCEDASQYNRTYPNDGVWVFDPATDGAPDDDSEGDSGDDSDSGDGGSDDDDGQDGTGDDGTGDDSSESGGSSDGSGSDDGSAGDSDGGSNDDSTDGSDDESEEDSGLPGFGVGAGLAGAAGGALAARRRRGESDDDA
ncbi:alkaline phosphatase PhoX [Natronoarchaeum rubrum]|uniref:alkaline phosphatase PhoX n=1 Tax=Natronoarchaeum rubrum TaxID=755311 RepID=UPI00211279FD|nr:alkaline phosphatase PhoX [Natronoarchaeum rubrum]